MFWILLIGMMMMTMGAALFGWWLGKTDHEGS